MKAQTNIMDQILADSSQSRNSKSVSNKKGGFSTNGTSSLSLPKNAQQSLQPPKPVAVVPSQQVDPKPQKIQKNTAVSVITDKSTNMKRATSMTKTEDTMTTTTTAIPPELSWVYDTKTPSVDNMNELLAYAVTAQDANLPPISKKLVYDAINRLTGLLKRHQESLQVDTAACKKTKDEFRDVRRVIKSLEKEIENLNAVNEADRETILEREEIIEEVLEGQKKKEEDEPVNFSVTLKSQKTKNQMRLSSGTPAQGKGTPGPVSGGPVSGGNTLSSMKKSQTGGFSTKSKRNQEPGTRKNLKAYQKELLASNITLKERKLQCLEELPVICPEEDGFPLGDAIAEFCAAKKSGGKFIQMADQCQLAKTLIKQNQDKQLEVMVSSF